jgi:hypothetical protein
LQAEPITDRLKFTATAGRAAPAISIARLLQGISGPYFTETAVYVTTTSCSPLARKRNTTVRNVSIDFS